MKLRWICGLMIALMCTVAYAQEIGVGDIWLKSYEDDFRGARRLAEKAHENSPGDLERSALAVFFATDPTNWRPILNQMRSTAPESPWTKLAAAGSNGFGAVDLCEKAVQESKGEPGVLVLATGVLSKHANAAGEFAQVGSFIEKHRDEYAKHASTLIAQARALQMIAANRQDSSKRESLIELYDKALTLEPNNVSAILFKGKLLKSSRPSDGYEFFKAQATRLPDALPIHEAYWDAASTRPEAEKLQKEVTADVLRFFAKEPPSGSLLYVASGRFRDALPEVEKAAREFVLSKYPDSEAAERISLDECLKDLPLGTPEQNRDTQIEKLTAFVNRPKHVSAGTLENAYGHLAYRLAQQEKPDLGLLFRAVESQPGDMFWDSVRKLAEARYRLDDLERIVVAQLDEAWKAMRGAASDIPDPHWAINFWISDRTVFWEGAAAYVYLQQGKLEEAEAKLKIAADLGGGTGAQSMVDLGRIYEARKELDKAEKQYLSALGASFRGQGDHPAVEALRALYLLRNKGGEGLDAYLKPILEKEREQRKAKVLATRIRNASDIPEFKFNTLDGKEVTSGSLKGKVLVINFWATWCGPCRKEMPDLEKFYQKYKDDPKVVVMAVSTDAVDTPTSAVEAVIKRGNYQFQVLRGADYATANRINTIPMTWFVDPSGKRAFQQLGLTKDLDEEFAWRVEELKKPAIEKPAIESLAEQKKPVS